MLHGGGGAPRTFLAGSDLGTAFAAAGLRGEPGAAYLLGGFDGSLGFRLGGEFQTRFWSQALYTWGDPMLDTHWETAIAGYKVFVRTEAAP